MLILWIFSIAKFVVFGFLVFNLGVEGMERGWWVSGSRKSGSGREEEGRLVGFDSVKSVSNLYKVVERRGHEIGS